MGIHQHRSGSLMRHTAGESLSHHLSRYFCKITLIILTLIMGGCTSIPSGLTPVTGFEADRYLGKWYEIARLDHVFERGLDHVTAEYTKRPDGAIVVANRGYDARKQRWHEAKGVARFRGEPTIGSLKVTFFWPFTGGYHVIALDRDYQWALIVGPSRKYLWILAREPRLAPEIYDRLVRKAREAGFPTDNLIRVSHASPP
jgi:apolipoprotein D and lipocalin family protein